MTQSRMDDEAPSVSVVSLSEPPPPQSFPGTHLVPGQMLAERYEIIRPLASGATATVYLGKHTLIDRMVAIKLLDPALKTNEKLVQRFLNEGRAVGALGHPHIVESTDLGYTPDGTPFLVLEYLEGKDLCEEIETTGPLDLPRALRIGTQIASALAAAHAKGIVHRDMKSENVFLVQQVGKEDHVKVVDFGISKFLTGAAATEAGELFGTADYLSPEQIGASDAVDARTDVYSTGVILYHMLTGHLPYETIEFPEVLQAIVMDAPPPMSRWRTDLPPEVCEIVERCVEKKPEVRYQTMAELGSALSGALENRASFVSLGPPPSPRPGSLPPASSRRGSLAPDATTAMEQVPPSMTGRATASHSIPADPSLASTETPSMMQAGDPAPSPAKRWALVALAAAVALGAGWSFGSTTAPADAAGPTPSPAAAAPEEVSLRIESPAGGTVSFRGRQHLLPFAQDVKPSTQQERIDVQLQSGQTRTLWLTIDQPRRVFVATTQ